MKPIFLITFFLVSISLFSQKVPTLKPEIGKTYDFSQEGQELWAVCDSLNFHKSFKEKLTQEKFSELSNKCDEINYNEACDGMWSIICGNDWTDEGYNIAYYMNDSDYQFTTASSALKAQNKITYGSENIGDLNYQTA